MNDFSYAYPNTTTPDTFAGADAMSDMFAGVSGALLIALFAFYGLFFVYFIVAYILQAISLQTIAKRRGISKPWLAWIPFGINWIVGAIARDHDKRNGINRRWDKILLTISLIAGLLCFVLEVLAVIALIWIAMNSANSYMSEEGALIIVLLLYSLLIPILFLVSIFSVLQTICVFKIFESTVPKRALTYFMIYFIVPFAAPFCLFACRNKGYAVTSDDLIFEQINTP